jgi:hypothetical protein
VPDAPVFEPRTPFETAFRNALEGADAYRAVRAGLRLHDDILRIGNRFVAIDRFREIAFVAMGNAAGAMALAAQEMLGERLTQGLTVSPIPPPDALQFRGVLVPDAWPGSSAAADALAGVLELAGDLKDQDLLLVLLSPGARSGSVDAARVARVLGTGAVGGRLGAAASAPMVVTLVVDRGEGPEWIGGGPTIPLRPDETARVQHLVGEAVATDRSRSAPLAVGRNVLRPVVVTGPADAIEAAGNQLAGQGWISRMIALHVPGTPDEVADQFVKGMETIRREQVAEPRRLATNAEERDSDTAIPSIPVPTTDTPAARPESRGLAVFASATFNAIEGGEGAPEVRAYLRAISRQSPRREAYLGALRTAGDLPGRGNGAGSWLGRRVGAEPSDEPAIETFAVRPGFTDVGTLLVGFVPWVAR